MAIETQFPAPEETESGGVLPFKKRHKPLTWSYSNRAPRKSLFTPGEITPETRFRPETASILPSESSDSGKPRLDCHRSRPAPPGSRQGRGVLGSRRREVAEQAGGADEGLYLFTL
jgi:hypothetical protein